MTLFLNNCRNVTLSSVNLLRSSLITSQILTRHSSYDSKKFPGYHVIYYLDRIKAVSIVNRTKRNATILFGIITPSSCALDLFNILPYSITLNFTIAGFSVALFLHSVGYFCNNIIGFVYSKENTDDLIISYVNYWGNRVDIQTTANDIDCVQSAATYVKPLFNTMNIFSPKRKLRIYIKGKITDEKKFYKLFNLPM